MTDCQKLLLGYADRLYGPHHPHTEEGEGERGDSLEEGRTPQGLHEGDSQSTIDGGQSSPPTAEVSPPDPSPPPSSGARVLPRGRLSLVSVGGVEGLAFIACNDERIRPAVVVSAVLDDLRLDRLPAPLSPHLYRLLPILYTASAASLTTLVPSSSLSLLPSSLTSPFTFSVLYRHSNTQGPQIERAEVIRALAGRVVREAVTRQLEGRVQLVRSDVTVLCWIVKSVAFIGVMEGYDDRHHYNLMELLKQRAQPPLPAPAHHSAIVSPALLGTVG